MPENEGDTMPDIGRDEGLGSGRFVDEQRIGDALLIALGFTYLRDMGCWIDEDHARYDDREAALDEACARVEAGEVEVIAR